MRPRVPITTGDPAGIGPEIAALAAADPRSPAFDIASKGIADHTSLVEAVVLAAQLATPRKGDAID